MLTNQTISLCYGFFALLAAGAAQAQNAPAQDAIAAPGQKTISSRPRVPPVRAPSTSQI